MMDLRLHEIQVYTCMYAYINMYHYIPVHIFKSFRLQFKLYMYIDVKHSSKVFDKTVLSYPQDDESGSHIILEVLLLV